MRKHIAAIVCTAFLAGSVATVSTGCSASMQIGDKKPKKKAPPPPPPPKPAPAPAPAPEPAKFKMRGEMLQLPGPVVFETGSATLKPESDAVLQIVHDYLSETPRVTLLRIEGHTDSDGQDAANMNLSKGRAMSVAAWLVGKGIDCKRLMPVGFGETKPVATNDTPEGKAQNRRTAFINAAMEGKPIGGMPVDGGGQPAGDACK